MNKWTKRDLPTSRLRRHLEVKGLWNETKDTEYRVQARKDIVEAFNKAEKRKKPLIDEMFTDVYDKMTPMLEEQKREMEEHIQKYPGEYPTSIHAKELYTTRHGEPKKYI